MNEISYLKARLKMILTFYALYLILKDYVVVSVVLDEKRCVVKAHGLNRLVFLAFVVRVSFQ
jgi:hypothetical protein